MTADQVLQLAVNLANGWSPEDLGIDDSAALQKMLGEVYDQILQANRKAEQRMSKLVD